MSRLALFLLGPPRIERDGEPVDIRRRKALSLLVYLAVTRQSHSRDALATLFWPELDQGRARAGLRRALTALRKGVGEALLDADRETVGLNLDAEVRLDVDEFRDRLAECQTHGHLEDEVCPACLPLLAEAAALYRDDFLTGFTLPDSPAFDEWQFFQSEGLRTELASVLEHLARAHSSRDEFDQAIAYARRWLALDPLAEPAHRCLMHLYAWSGQRSAALRQYGECERVLREELGVSPEAETIQLYEAVEENREFPVPAAPISPQPIVRKHNLPVQLTAFVGREAMLTGIADRLQDPDCRLLTLVGPGGSGKTRLALEAAAAQLDNCAHGVFFVSLAPLQSVQAIVPTVAEALGFSFYTAAGGAIEGEPKQPFSAKQQLLDYLRQKTMIIIMDNFEHLLDGTVLVTEILETAPDVKILATSRERLNVQGEHLFPVAGMAFPERETLADTLHYSAVKLFMQSAQRVRPDLELRGDDPRHVARICRLVEGIPLAILLAAGWVQMLSPGEIAAQIGQSIDFLETDLRDVPERQRSMRAVFDHSWNLLTARERAVMQALSVFRGGFARDAVQQVTGASLRELRILVDKSLLHRTAAGRYGMHELLRQYAAEKLNESPNASETARDRHCAHYAAALQGWAADLKGPRQQTAMAEMDVEIANARAAWDWMAERGQVERLDQALEGLCLFYELGGRYQEGESACRSVAEQLEAMTSSNGLCVLAKILTWQGVFGWRLGRTESVRQLVRQSLALLEEAELADHEPVLSLPKDTRLEKAFILGRMGDLVSGFDREEARRLYMQSLVLYQALGDDWGTAGVLAALGWVAADLGAFNEARRLFEESLAIRQRLGDPRGIADLLVPSGVIAMFQGRFEEAEGLVRESTAIRQEIGDQASRASGLSGLGATLVWLGKYDEGHLLLEESIPIYNDLGSHRNLAFPNVMLGMAKMHLGRYEQARAHGHRSLTLSRELGNRRETGHSLRLLGSVALAGKAYAEAQELLQESDAVYRGIGQGHGLSMTLVVLGYAARGRGQLPQAREHLCEALRTAAGIRAFIPLVEVLPVMALLLADRGETERAMELYALASRYPFVANSRWFEDVAGRYIAAVAATLPPEVVAAAQERGRARDLDATVAELLAELGGQ